MADGYMAAATRHGVKGENTQPCLAALSLENNRASEREASDFNQVSPIAFLPAGRGRAFSGGRILLPLPESHRGSVAQSLPPVRPHGLQDARNPLPSLSSSSLRFMSIESAMPSNQLTLCCPLLLPSILPSIGGFSNELALHPRWPEYWSFSFGMSPSDEYSGLVSFRIDGFNLPAVQGTLKSCSRPQFKGWTIKKPAC